MSKIACLVVDDEADILEIYSEFLLVHFDAEIQIAANGLEAIEKCKEQKFDVIVTDFRMPKMSGGEFCAHLKNDSTLNRDTPIIVATGYAEEAKKSGMDLNQVKILEKPIEIDELIDMVSKLTGIATSQAS